MGKLTDFKDTNAKDLIPPKLGSGKTGMIGTPSYVAPTAEEASQITDQKIRIAHNLPPLEDTNGNNIPSPNLNVNSQVKDVDKGVANPNQGDAQATSQVPNIDVPQTFFQKNKMPILIGGGVAVVAIIGLIAFSAMSSNN